MSNFIYQSKLRAAIVIALLSVSIAGCGGTSEESGKTGGSAASLIDSLFPAADQRKSAAPVVPASFFSDIPLPAEATVKHVLADEFGDPVVVFSAPQPARELNHWFIAEASKNGWLQTSSTKQVDGGGSSAFKHRTDGRYFEVQIESRAEGSFVIIEYRGSGVGPPANITIPSQKVRALFDALVNGQQQLVAAEMQFDQVASTVHNGGYADTSPLRQCAVAGESLVARLTTAVGSVDATGVTGGQELLDLHLATLDAYKNLLSGGIPKMIAEAENPNLDRQQKHLAVFEPKQEFHRAVLPLKTQFDKQRHTFAIEHGLQSEF